MSRNHFKGSVVYSGPKNENVRTVFPFYNKLAVQAYSPRTEFYYTRYISAFNSNPYVKAHQLIPVLDESDNVISIDYDPEGSNKLPIYVLLSHRQGFEQSQFQDKNYILLMLRAVDLHYFVNSGTLHQAVVDGEKALVYMVYENKDEFDRELPSLGLDLKHHVLRDKLYDNLVSNSRNNFTLKPSVPS